MEYEKLSVRTKAGLVKTVGALVPMSAETLLEKEIEMPEEIVKGLLPVGAAILAGAPKSVKIFLGIRQRKAGCCIWIWKRRCICIKNAWNS